MEYKIEREIEILTGKINMKFVLYKDGKNILKERIGRLFKYIGEEEILLNRIVKRLEQLEEENDVKFKVGYTMYEIHIYINKEKEAVKYITKKVVNEIKKIITELEEKNNNSELKGWIKDKMIFIFKV